MRLITLRFNGDLAADATDVHLTPRADHSGQFRVDTTARSIECTRGGHLLGISASFNPDSTVIDATTGADLEALVQSVEDAQVLIRVGDDIPVSVPLSMLLQLQIRSDDSTADLLACSPGHKPVPVSWDLAPGKIISVEVKRYAAAAVALQQVDVRLITGV